MKIKNLKQFQSYCKKNIFPSSAEDMGFDSRIAASLFLAITADAAAGAIVAEGRMTKRYATEASLIREVVNYLSIEIGGGRASDDIRKVVREHFADPAIYECSITMQVAYLMFRPYWVTGDYLQRFNSIMFHAEDESMDHKALLNQIILELMQFGFDFEKAKFHV